jgi:hypothetical protein
MIREARAIFVMAGAALFLVACGSASSESEAAIAQVLKQRLETPGAELIVDPIAADGAFAVAGWTHGEKGGRALLQKGSKGWLLVLCGGESLRSMQGLTRLGVPQHQAMEIIKELAREEKRVSAERLARMASFTGEVRM